MQHVVVRGLIICIEIMGRNPD